MSKTIFITGASSGLGKLTATYFAEQGWQVAATMRTPEKETQLTKYPNVKLFKLDVVDVEQVQAAVTAAWEAFGKVDVVLNNAGIGSYGPLEFAEESTIDRIFQVNVRGPLNVIRAFLPYFRERREGMFINVSSFMGVTTAVPIGSLYNMSKFALEGAIEGLYYELKPLGIELRMIEQGGSSGNNFGDNIIWNTNPAIKDYDQITGKVKELMAAAADRGMLDDPQIIVDAIYEQATGQSKKFRSLVGAAGQGLMAMRNSMPIEEYMDKMYANFL